MTADNDEFQRDIQVLHVNCFSSIQCSAILASKVIKIRFACPTNIVQCNFEKKTLKMSNYAKRQLNVCQNYFSQTSMSFYVANIVHEVLVFEGNNYMES